MKKVENIYIDSNTLKDNRLSNSERIILGYLYSSISFDERFSWASNKYLSKIFNLSESTISKYITKFKSMKFFNTLYFENHRKIIIPIETKKAYESLPNKLLVN